MRKVLDLFEFVENESSEGAMIFADFEKAFDSIEHTNAPDHRESHPWALNRSLEAY